MKNESSMRNRSIDLIIAWFVVMLVLLFSQGCTMQKEVQTVKAKSETATKSEERSVTTAETQTNTTTRATARTVTTEDCDTLIPVQVPVGDPVPGQTGKVGQAYATVQVPVRIRRTITREEYSVKQQEKVERSAVTLQRKNSNIAATTMEMKNRNVERTGLPWWITTLVVIGLVITILIFIIRKTKFLSWLRDVNRS